MLKVQVFIFVRANGKHMVVLIGVEPLDNTWDTPTPASPTDCLRRLGMLLQMEFSFKQKVFLPSGKLSLGNCASLVYQRTAIFIPSPHPCFSPIGSFCQYLRKTHCVLFQPVGQPFPRLNAFFTSFMLWCSLRMRHIQFIASWCASDPGEPPSHEICRQLLV